MTQVGACYFDNGQCGGILKRAPHPCGRKLADDSVPANIAGGTLKDMNFLSKLTGCFAMPAAADPVYAELRSFINGLTEDEQIDLVALAWIGRGDGGIAEWDSIREEAARTHNNRTAEYLLGMPLLPDYLEDALSELDHSCEEVEDERF